MSARAVLRRCGELRATVRRLVYQGRHGEHPNPTAALLVIAVTVAGTAMMVGAWLSHPLVTTF